MGSLSYQQMTQIPHMSEPVEKGPFFSVKISQRSLQDLSVILIHYAAVLHGNNIIKAPLVHSQSQGPSLPHLRKKIPFYSGIQTVQDWL